MLKNNYITLVTLTFTLFTHASKIIGCSTTCFQILKKIIPRMHLLWTHMREDNTDSEDESIRLFGETLPNGPELDAGEGEYIFTERCCKLSFRWLIFHCLGPIKKEALLRWAWEWSNTGTMINLPIDLIQPLVRLTPRPNQKLFLCQPMHFPQHIINPSKTVCCVSHIDCALIPRKQIRSFLEVRLFGITHVCDFRKGFFNGLSEILNPRH